MKFFINFIWRNDPNNYTKMKLIDNCTIKMQVCKDFKLYAPGVPNNFIISRGEGFLVAVSEQSTWHGER